MASRTRIVSTASAVLAAAAFSGMLTGAALAASSQQASASRVVVSGQNGIQLDTGKNSCSGANGCSGSCPNCPGNNGSK